MVILIVVVFQGGLLKTTFAVYATLKETFMFRLSQHDIFKPASPEEITRRDEEWENTKLERIVKQFKGVQRADGKYDFPGTVDLNYFDDTFITIPPIFGRVTGSFWTGAGYKTSLVGCPEYVGGDFYCPYNQLTSLLGCPEYVGGDFICSDNCLTTLEGCPKFVGGDFYCSDNSHGFTREYIRSLCNVGGSINASPNS
jgi:hypothetical protein